MAVNPYTSQSISGYNASPPADDGSQTDANKVKWSSHKNKLADPIKTLSEAINTQNVSAFNTLALESWTESTTTATIVEADWHKGILQTATDPINFPAPNTLEDGWHTSIYNGATGVVSLVGTATGSFYNFAGSHASELQLNPGDGLRIMNTATIFLPLVIDNASVITTEGDLIIGNSSGADSRLAAATTDGWVLTASATTAVWAANQPSVGQHTIAMPAKGMTSRTTAGAAAGSSELSSNKNMSITFDFDDTTREHVQFDVGPMPESWDEGTFVAQFLWEATGTATGEVVWGIQAVALGDDDAADVAFGTAQTVTSEAGGAVGDIAKSAETSAITPANTATEGDLVQFQVYRDATATGDTLTGDAKIRSVRLHYMTEAENDS